MKYTLLVNGDIDWFSFSRYAADYDCLIAVDGGAEFAYNNSLSPDIVIGDMDSIRPELLLYYEKSRSKIMKYPSEKDDIDSALAVKYAVNYGAEQIVIAGGAGNRLDHSYANICLLYYLAGLDIIARIVSDKHVIQIIKEKAVFKGEAGRILSFLPFAGDTHGVTLNGFKYPLDKATLYLKDPIGVSNKIESDEATVELQKGDCLLSVLNIE